MASNAKYRYAYLSEESNGHKLICIDDVGKEQRRANTFWCIGCGGEMKAALGEKRLHYFSHKNNERHCSKETYLHKLGKSSVIEYFLSHKTFNIHIKSRNKCRRIERCKLRHLLHECTDFGEQEIDLKEYYDKCEEEYTYKGFRADVALIAKGRRGSPIFVEIAVSHKCDEDKRNSGLPIIEWEIKDENDLDSRYFDSYFGERWHPNFTPKIELINFREERPRYMPKKRIYLHKFLVLKTLESTIITTKCNEADTRVDGSILEIVSRSPRQDLGVFHRTCIAVSIERLGTQFKHCSFCLINYICICRGVKYTAGNEVYHIKQASICSTYRPDKDMLKFYSQKDPRAECSITYAEQEDAKES